WYSLLGLPLLFSAMVFMAASFSFRLARLGGMPQLVLAAALSGFLVYFLGNVTQALGQSGILPTPLAAIAPALAATLLGMTLLFHAGAGGGAGGGLFLVPPLRPGAPVFSRSRRHWGG